MDIGAFAQIEDLEEVAKKNGIHVPRLRGYRLMKDETPVDLDNIPQDIYWSVYDAAISSDPPWYPENTCFFLGAQREKRYKKYGIFEGGKCNFTNLIGLKWNLIHGKRRKRIKFAMKNELKRYKKQYELWNKYCGRDDVLYIHARLGGYNWYYWDGNKIEKEPWFIEKVDDYYDYTYCDIYAKIEVIEKKENENP